MPPTQPTFHATGLVPGQTYRVIRPFEDYDRRTHLPGETWRFLQQNFLPYEDGLTLRVEQAGQQEVIRLQWRPETQADIIDRFSEYVTALPGAPLTHAPLVRARRRRKSFRWATLLGILMLIPVFAVVILVSLYRLPNPPGGSNPASSQVTVSVTAGSNVKTTDPFLVDVLVKNDSDRPQTIESVSFDTPYLEGSRLDRSDPPYERLSRTTLSVEFFTYEYNQAVPARSSQTIRFYLKSARPGDYSGQVMVCLNGARPCGVYPVRTLVIN